MQVWDANITNKASDQTIVMFRGTQLIPYPKK